MSERQLHQQHFTTTTLIKNDLDIVDDIDETGVTVHYEKDDTHQLQQRQLDEPVDDVDGHERNGCWQNRVTKVVLKVVFSTPGLIVLVVLYTVMGALVFPILETSGKAATASRNLPSISKSRDECLKELWIITERLNVLYERNWTLLVHDQLTRFERSILAATKNGGLIETVGDHYPRWSFTEALLYSLTVITTIGHGNLTPHTAEGKLVTMLYAIVGVPLMLMCLSSLGELFANALQCSYAKLCASSKAGGGQQKVKFLGQVGHKDVEYHACNEISCSQCKYDLPKDAILSEKPNKCLSMNEHDDSYHLIMDSPSKAGNNTSSPCVLRKSTLQDNNIRKSIMKPPSVTVTSPQQHLRQQIGYPVGEPHQSRTDTNAGSAVCSNFHCYPTSPTAVCMGRRLSADENFEGSDKSDLGAVNRKINCHSPSHQHSHNHRHHHNHCRHVQQRQQLMLQEETMTTATVHGLIGRRKPPLMTGHDHQLGAKVATTNFIKNNPDDYAYHLDNYSLASPNRRVTVNTTTTNNSNSIGGTKIGAHIIDEVDEDDDSENRNGCSHGTPSRIPLIGRKSNSCAVPSDDDDINTNDDAEQANHRRHIEMDRFSDTDTSPQVPFTVIFLIMFGYLTIGTVIFTIWENWTLVDGAYFCFITLSTIGFGDLVPQKTLIGPDLQIYACCAYLLLGLVLMAMSFSLIETQLVWKLRRLAIRLKMTKD